MDKLELTERYVGHI